MLKEILLSLSKRSAYDHKHHKVTAFYPPALFFHKSNKRIPVKLDLTVYIFKYLLPLLCYYIQLIVYTKIEVSSYCLSFTSSAVCCLCCMDEVSTLELQKKTSRRMRTSFLALTVL